MFKSLDLASWQYKLYLVGALPIFVCVSIIAIASHTLTAQSESLQKAIDTLQQRQDVALSFMVANLSLNAEVKSLIAASSSDDIRKSAIATIKATSIVEEELTKLSQSLAGDAIATRMRELFDGIKPRQMQVIGQARRNNDAEAMVVANELDPLITELEGISLNLVKRETQSLSELKESNIEQNQKLTFSLVVFFLLGSFASVGVALFFGRTLIKKLNYVRFILGRVRDGDLTEKVDTSSRCEIGEVNLSISETMANIAKTVSKISHRAQRLNTDTNTVEAAAHDSHERANKLTATYESINASTRRNIELSEQTSDNLQQAKVRSSQASDKAQQALEHAKVTRSSMAELKKAIQSANHRAEDMGEAVKSITAISANIAAISEQTNLLALNAAIEAARAGESGRGFAVVADEVRSLAYRSNESVDQIANLANQLTQSVEQMVAQMSTTKRQVEVQDDEFQSTLSTILDAENLIRTSEESIEQTSSLGQKQVMETEAIIEEMEKLQQVIGAATQSVINLEDLSESLGKSSYELKSLVSYFKLNGDAI